MSMAAEAVSSSISVIPGLPASVEILGWARARYVFQALEDWLMSEPAKQLPLHEIEREQERRGREIQRLLLESFQSCLVLSRHFLYRDPRNGDAYGSNIGLSIV